MIRTNKVMSGGGEGVINWDNKNRGKMGECSPLRLLLLLLPEEVFNPGHPEGDVDAKHADEDV